MAKWLVSFVLTRRRRPKHSLLALLLLLHPLLFLTLISTTQLSIPLFPDVCRSRTRTGTSPSFSPGNTSLSGPNITSGKPIAPRLRKVYELYPLAANLHDRIEAYLYAWDMCSCSIHSPHLIHATISSSDPAFAESEVVSPLFNNSLPTMAEKTVRALCSAIEAVYEQLDRDAATAQGGWKGDAALRAACDTARAAVRNVSDFKYNWDVGSKLLPSTTDLELLGYVLRFTYKVRQHGYEGTLLLDGASPITVKSHRPASSSSASSSSSPSSSSSSSSTFPSTAADFASRPTLIGHREAAEWVLQTTLRVLFRGEFRPRHDPFVVPGSTVLPLIDDLHAQLGAILAPISRLADLGDAWLRGLDLGSSVSNSTTAHPWWPWPDLLSLLRTLLPPEPDYFAFMSRHRDPDPISTARSALASLRRVPPLITRGREKLASSSSALQSAIDGWDELAREMEGLVAQGMVVVASTPSPPFPPGPEPGKKKSASRGPGLDPEEEEVKTIFVVRELDVLAWEVQMLARALDWQNGFVSRYYWCLELRAYGELSEECRDEFEATWEGVRGWF